MGILLVFSKIVVTLHSVIAPFNGFLLDPCYYLRNSIPNFRTKSRHLTLRQRRDDGIFGVQVFY